MKRALIMRTTKLSAIALAALGALLATPAHAVTSITACPYTITAPGDYRLDADLSCTGDAITIQASHVHLSLNTHQLTGSLSSDRGIVVYSATSRLTDVEIKGPGVLSAFGEAVELDNADNSKVESVTASFCVVGIATGAVSGTTVTNVRLNKNVLALAFGVGVALGNSTNGQVQENVMNGFVFLAGSAAGIAVTGGSGNVIENNTTLGYIDGISVGVGGVGSASSGNHIHDNVSSGNVASGIHIATGSGNNVVEHNTALGNTAFNSAGIDLLDDNPTCGTNRWHDNIFITATPPCAGQ
ncbi:MAG: right-handed parallel beta-helix repeat-containing protein [Thermoanaerobaculia bacterium]